MDPSLHDPLRRGSVIITCSAEQMLLINFKIRSHTHLTTACDMKKMLSINFRRRIHIGINIAYRVEEVSLPNSVERCHNCIILYLHLKKWQYVFPQSIVMKVQLLQMVSGENGTT